jgi:ribokinase
LKGERAVARSIVVVGSSNTDMIVKLDRIPKPGETRLGGEFMTAAGGKGANQAVAAARAGGAVTLVARVGQDMFGERALSGLAKNGVNVDYVQCDKCSSGVALIFVGEDGENSIAVASGANAKLSPADVRKAKRAFADAGIVMMQLESPLETVQAAADLAAARGIPVILNPAPAQPLPEKLLKKVSILTPNEIEAELLTGIKVNSEASCARAADILRRQGVETVVITLGASGAYIAAAAGKQRVSGFRMKAVDTTAAGDVFNGALAVALAEGLPLIHAVRFANAAGALSVTRMGAQPSAPTRREIEKLVKGQRRLSLDGPAGVPMYGLKINGRSVRKPSVSRSRT